MPTDVPLTSLTIRMSDSRGLGRVDERQQHGGIPGEGVRPSVGHILQSSHRIVLTLNRYDRLLSGVEMIRRLANPNNKDYDEGWENLSESLNASLSKNIR